MRPTFQRAGSRNKRLWAIPAIFGALLLLLRMMSGQGSAQSSGERVIENLVPKHVPIKVKMKEDKERALKDMKNNKWTHDFALEVTNTSDKPIYFLELWLVMPEILDANGYPVGFTLRYGRIDFVEFKARVTRDDIPIQPNESHIFKIEEPIQRSWENYKASANKPDPTKIEISFTQLSFGDGSGFNGTDAKPYPYVREKSSNAPCRQSPEAVDDIRNRNGPMNRLPDVYR